MVFGYVFEYDLCGNIRFDSKNGITIFNTGFDYGTKYENSSDLCNVELVMI